MSDAYRLYRQGLDALDAGHADEAIAPLERAKSLEPDSGSIREALGKTYLQVGFYDRAIAEFTFNVEQDPVDAYAHFCLGRAHDRSGDARAARHHYRMATLLEPDRRIYVDTLNAFLNRVERVEELGGRDTAGEQGGPMIFGD